MPESYGKLHIALFPPAPRLEARWLGIIGAEMAENLF
jgi:hypothetical protein